MVAMRDTDFDLLVIGHETEGCLTAVAAAQAGARVAFLCPPDALLGGLLTEDGLAFVDRDARHLLPPDQSPHDGLFGRFLARAGVPLVALEAQAGHRTLAAMLAEAGVTRIDGHATAARVDHQRVQGVHLADGQTVSARHFIDATPDGDVAELAGVRFVNAFTEYGDPRALGVSPLPIVEGASPARIMATCEALAADPGLEALRVQAFGDRRFLDLELGADYILVGPPYLGLAYQRWREAQGIAWPYAFEADGFNVATLGPTTTSWNGLMYFVHDAPALLSLSRGGADAIFTAEVEVFGRFLREGLGWHEARTVMPRGVYVRQTRHAIDVRHRLTLAELAHGYAEGSVGTFCYYPDFRGFHAPKVPAPLTAHVILAAGLAAPLKNLGLASRAAGYTAYAHSLCRLVQYNVTLGTALGVAAAITDGEMSDVDFGSLKHELGRQHALADDPSGFERNASVARALSADSLITRETAAWA